MQKPVGGGFDARHTNNLGVQPKSTTVSEPPKKPLGWDDDDDYLEFKAKEKQENQRSGSSVVEKIDGDRATLHCPKCDFKFIYNISSRTPSSCPYCGVKLNINVK
jgi:rubrerythrin